MILRCYLLVLLFPMFGIVHLKESGAYLKYNNPRSEINLVKTDSVCFEKFYNSINTFLNPDRSAINTFDEELVDCCMQLIASGDTVAKNILYDRISKRIEKFTQGNGDYISIYKIIPETLGTLPESKSLELCMILFENTDIQIYDGICFQLGFSVFKNAILNIIDYEKVEKYKNLSVQNYRLAISNGLSDCEVKAYVVTQLYPILVGDLENGELKLRESMKQ